MTPGSSLSSSLPCILCGCSRTAELCQCDGKGYLHCPACDLIFMHPGYRPDPEAEKSEYELHENHPEDPAYRTFLSQLFDPIQEKLHPGSVGLDFGSGPGPALHLMFEEMGHTMSLYDPFFADNPEVFESEYDFITVSETAEHLYNPAKEFSRLWQCLKPGGYLGIMTLFAPPLSEFPGWFYRREVTHVTFYSKTTFRYMAKKWGTVPEFHGKRVVLFRKQAAV
jgi:SAM-dependent methyltransferase